MEVETTKLSVFKMEGRTVQSNSTGLSVSESEIQVGNLKNE